LVKVSKEDLDSYRNGKITLREIQEKSTFLMMYSWDLSDARDVRVITPTELEQLNYMAQEGSYISPSSGVTK
jgi:hypothetical protein